jgi:hypothetical protein
LGKTTPTELPIVVSLRVNITSPCYNVSMHNKG